MAGIVSGASRCPHYLDNEVERFATMYERSFLIAMKRRAVTTPTTTAQSLGSLIGSARKIMRKDRGLNGDLDRLPMLTWIMFLKFLDDLETQREEESKL